MKALVIAIVIATGLVGVAVYRERKSEIKAWFRNKFTRVDNNEDNKTEYQKHLERGGKDYRHIRK